MRPLAIVTGASSGLGEVYAKELARRGYDLAICARRIDRLNSLKPDLEAFGAKVFVSQTDLLVGEELREFFKQATKLMPPKMLVNNAGFGSIGRFSSVDISRELDMIQLNCQALVELSYLAYQEMAKANGGTIINLASVAAYPPMTYMTTYGATKSFVHSFSLALAAEAKDFGVHVMCHCPGPTESEFHLVSGLSEKMNHIPSMKALPVVCKALDCAAKKRSVCINGKLNLFLSMIAKITPGSIAGNIVKYVLRKEAS